MTISSKDIVGTHVRHACEDDNIAIVEHLSELENIPTGVRMDSYVVALLTKGHATFFVDGESHKMNVNQLFIFRPYITLERTMLSADAEYHILVISPQYTQSLIAMGGQSGWDVMLLLSTNPIIELTSVQATTFLQYYQLIRQKLMHHHNRHYKEVVDSLFFAMLYEFHDIIEHHFRLSERKFSSTETIFHKFYEILNTTKPKYQKVEYYAEQLNITPKYFSSICKKLTGKTAMQHITNAVIKDITMLLRDENLSIKQISQMIGFPNQSFLGSYVRKHLGISPQKYRDQLRQNIQNA